mmetsp:Transcript_1632/g.2592  ORF Transcript_1632/g.2592 Transcript_1632/m.2592 type:complete len:160 (+) Transcript_1632:534-1013(+)
MPHSIGGMEMSQLTKLNRKYLPPSLMLHLKRFKYTNTCNSGWRVTKVMSDMFVPLQLDLDPYTSGADGDDCATCEYQLRAVIVHLGTAEEGHYVTYALINENQWMMLDDSTTTAVDVEEVLKAAAGVKNSKCCRSDVNLCRFESADACAYILHYVRCSE